MNGIINLLKPPCLSSAQAVSFIKRLTGEKVGHAGTLDPEACGVLPIMVGRATKLFDYLSEKTKVYVAETAFGTATDTQDSTGQVIERGDHYPTAQQVKSVLPRFVGDTLQVPPQYSALKRGGIAMYELARRGQKVTLEARPIQISRLDYLGPTTNQGHLLRVYCGRGTYIRTLCHDIGQALGCPAHMRLLIRESTGPFEICRAATVEELTQTDNWNMLRAPWLITLEQAVSHLPRVQARPETLSKCVNGAVLPLDSVLYSDTITPGGVAALWCMDQLVGIYQREGDTMRLKTFLYG